MIKSYRVIFMLNGAALALFATWAQFEFERNAYLQVWLANTGLTELFFGALWGSFGLGVLTYLVAMLSKDLFTLATSSQGPLIGGEAGPGKTVPAVSSQPLEQRAEPAVSSTAGSPEPVREAKPGDFDYGAPHANTRAAPSDEMSLITIPKESALMRWVKEKDGKYRLVQNTERNV